MHHLHGVIPCAAQHEVMRRRHGTSARRPAYADARLLDVGVAVTAPRSRLSLRSAGMTLTMTRGVVSQCRQYRRTRLR